MYGSLDPRMQTDVPYDRNGLLLSNYGVMTETVVIAAGSGNIGRGTVLGQVTATGKYRPCDASATDGSQIPSAILADQADATSADAKTAGFLAGQFDGALVVLGPGWTLQQAADALRRMGIFVKVHRDAC